MHYAVRRASSQMIKILLLYNVDMNAQDNVYMGITQLFFISLSFTLFDPVHYLSYLLCSHLCLSLFSGWLDTITFSCSISQNRYSEAFINQGS